MNTLEQKIAELTEKHNIEQKGKDMFPDLKIFTHAFTYKEKNTTLSINIDLLRESYSDVKYTNEEICTIIQEVISKLPPTQNNALYFAGKDSIQTESPFVFRFDNGINSCHVKIDYISNEFWVKIEIPVYFYQGNDVLEPYTRSVSDSEHHYFGGTSMSEIRKMNIRAYKLRMFDCQKYYGGDAVCYLMKPEFKEKFESIVLTGKPL